jgi:hypothetical protein
MGAVDALLEGNTLQQEFARLSLINRGTITFSVCLKFSLRGVRQRKQNL